MELPTELIAQLSAFAQIVLIDVSLAGDNAIIVGMAAAGLPAKERKRAIVIGIGAATVLRIVFAAFTVQLLQIIGLTLAGGLLLLWVSWKLFHNIRQEKNIKQEKEGAAALSRAIGGNGKVKAPQAVKGYTLKDAVIQIVVADVSMSLDNVLAVAGAARDHVWIMVAGLALSVVLMGAAATLIVKLLERYRWIGYAGLLVIVYVALRMIWDGGTEVSHELAMLT